MTPTDYDAQLAALKEELKTLSSLRDGLEVAGRENLKARIAIADRITALGPRPHPSVTFTSEETGFREQTVTWDGTVFHVKDSKWHSAGYVAVAIARDDKVDTIATRLLALKQGMEPVTDLDIIRALEGVFDMHQVSVRARQCVEALRPLFDRVPPTPPAFTKIGACSGLERALEDVSLILTVPAAEYVPAISDAFARIDTARTATPRTDDEVREDATR